MIGWALWLNHTPMVKRFQDMGGNPYWSTINYNVDYWVSESVKKELNMRWA